MLLLTALQWQIWCNLLLLLLLLLLWVLYMPAESASCCPHSCPAQLLAAASCRIAKHHYRW
jgi:hypothetical protein